MQIFLHFYKRIFSKKPHFYERMFSGKPHFYERMFSEKLHFYERMFSGKLHFYERMFSGKLHFYERYGALAGFGIPIKEALRGFCNKIVTRFKHVSFRQKVDRQTASEARMEHKKALAGGPSYYSFCPKMEYSSPSLRIIT